MNNPRTGDPLAVGVRLHKFAALRTGWLNGAGEPPDAAGLRWLADAFAELYPDDLPAPHFYPTPSGGVRAEWTLGPCDASLEIDLTELAGFWHSLNLATNAEETAELRLDSPAEWERLGGLIRPLREEAP